VYASWGLGVSTAYHLLNPWTQIAMRKLGTEEKIWGREVDPSGNRWQVGGSWATDESTFLLTPDFLLFCLSIRHRKVVSGGPFRCWKKVLTALHSGKYKMGRNKQDGRSDTRSG